MKDDESLGLTREEIVVRWIKRWLITMAGVLVGAIVGFGFTCLIGFLAEAITQPEYSDTLSWIYLVFIVLIPLFAILFGVLFHRLGGRLLWAGHRHQDNSAIITTIDGKRQKRFRLAGLITGLFGASMGPVVWLLWAMPRFQQTSLSSIELFFMAMVLIRWVVVAASWKWAFIGGLLLIGDGVFLAIFLSDGPLGFWLFTCSPLIISGILFIFSWREGRKYPSGNQV